MFINRMKRVTDDKKLRRIHGASGLPLSPTSSRPANLPKGEDQDERTANCTFSPFVSKTPDHRIEEKGTSGAKRNL